MKSYAYSEDEFDSSLFYQIWNEVINLKYYFRKFNKNESEAMQLTVLHALKHFSPSKGDLVPYIKTLARDITKDNGKIVFCDFLEQTVSSESDSISSTKVNISAVADISESVIENLYLSLDRKEEIIELALAYMNFFILMCDSIINKDTTTVYFPEIYTKECLKLNKLCKDFNKICLVIYNEYKSKFSEFLSADIGNIGVWRETDCDLINKNSSKRVRLVNKETGIECKDLDSENWGIKGNLGNKLIVKVPYFEEYDMMCDLIDEDGINMMKFTIDYSFIIRTLGGSISIVNPILFNEYELCKLEILTNLIHDLEGRYLGIGSQCMYFLINNNEKYLSINKRVIKGVPLNFKVINVTPIK